MSVKYWQKKERNGRHICTIGLRLLWCNNHTEICKRGLDDSDGGETVVENGYYHIVKWSKREKGGEWDNDYFKGVSTVTLERFSF